MDNQDNKPINSTHRHSLILQWWLKLLLQVILCISALLATLYFLVRSFYPLPQMVEAYASSKYTRTPIPPTSTRLPTSTKTPTPTLTASPTFTQTSLPSSAYETDIESINPDPPTYGVAAVILNDDFATVEPPFSDIQWTDSSTIATQIEREILEPYHATFGSGSAEWKMDLPLSTGYYEVFVLDTLFSSGGTLSFDVYLGDSKLTPLVGTTNLEYKSSQGNPPQRTDLWRSIGIFNFSTENLLSIKTSWGTRDESTIVAIDRILILKLSSAEETILSKIPEGYPIYIVDDSNAVFEPEQYWESRKNTTSWGRDFQIVKNPPIDLNVTWVVPEPLPVTKYDVWVWTPEIHGTIETTYKFFAEGNEIALVDGSTSSTITPGTNVNGAWVKIGTWQIPEHYGTQADVTILMTVKGNTIGDVSADMIAFIPSP